MLILVSFFVMKKIIYVSSEKYISTKKIYNHQKNTTDDSIERNRFFLKIESIFWWIVKDRRLFWYICTRQKNIWSYTIDFYFPELLLWIKIYDNYFKDIDKYQRYKDTELFKIWILIVRFSYEEIKKDILRVIIELKQIIKERREVGI
jgi:very-short-patch-repair endonuclease